ncbi:hypothetical protein D9M68_542230 [compost metagenome]
MAAMPQTIKVILPAFPDGRRLRTPLAARSKSSSTGFGAGWFSDMELSGVGERLHGFVVKGGGCAEHFQGPRRFKQ